MTQPTRDLVVAKLNELKSRAKTAEHFGMSRQTLRARLDERGVDTVFSGRNSTRPWHKSSPDEVPKEFNVGDFAMWCPSRPRGRCFGLPIATIPLRVEIKSKRTPTGHYRCVVVDMAYRKQLSKSGHVIHENALKEIKEAV